MYKITSTLNQLNHLPTEKKTLLSFMDHSIYVTGNIPTWNIDKTILYDLPLMAEQIMKMYATCELIDMSRCVIL